MAHPIQQEIDDLDNNHSNGLIDSLPLEDRTELDKIFEHMTKLENLQYYTELNKQEVIGYASLRSLSDLAKKYKIDYSIIDSWVQHSLINRVSLGRKGRAELVKVAARQQTEFPMQNQQNRFNWFRR